MPDIAETSLEQTFSDLANARLRDKSPSLLPYLAGFELRSHSPEGDEATGLFGFEVNHSWYYAPVWFKNGEVKGPYALYSVEDDLFFPMTEELVNELIEKQENQLGKPDSRSRMERGVRNPDYVRLRQLPSGSGGISTGVSLFNKQASHGSFDEILSKMAGARAYAWASIPEALSQLHPLKAAKIASELWSPTLRGFVSRFYSEADFPLFQTKKAAAPKKDDVIIVSQMGEPGCEELTDAEREKVIAGGVGVMDRRPDVAKSKVYQMETSKVLHTPEQGGLYEVLMADGNIRPLFCLRVPGSDRVDGQLIHDPEDGRTGWIRGRRVWTVRQQNPEAFREALEKDSVACEDVRPRDAVVFVNSNGEASFPFVIRDRIVGQDGIVVLNVERPYWVPNGSSAGATLAVSRGFVAERGNWHIPCPSERTTQVLIGEAGGSDPRYSSTRLILNRRNFRAIVLNRAKSEDGRVSWEYETPAHELEFRDSDFGDHQTIRQQLEKVAHEIKLWTTERGLVIRDQDTTREMSKTAGIISLIRDHGLGVEDAEMLVKQASRTPSRAFIKRAAMSDLLPMNELQDTHDGGLMSSYHPSQVMVEMLNKKSPDDNRDYYRYQSPFAGGVDDSADGHQLGQTMGGDPGSPKQDNTFDTMEQAAQTGQKDVFDAAVLGSLMKTRRAPELVERYLPTIASGMDRLGRLLFLTYQHYDDFKDRYGEQDIADLIENLESGFEQMGDLVSFLRKHTLAGDPSAHGMGLVTTPLGS